MYVALGDGSAHVNIASLCNARPCDRVQQLLQGTLFSNPIAFGQVSACVHMPYHRLFATGHIALVDVLLLQGLGMPMLSQNAAVGCRRDGYEGISEQELEQETTEDTRAIHVRPPTQANNAT